MKQQSKFENFYYGNCSYTIQLHANHIRLDIFYPFALSPTNVVQCESRKTKRDKSKTFSLDNWSLLAILLCEFVILLCEFLATDFIQSGLQERADLFEMPSRNFFLFQAGQSRHRGSSRSDPLLSALNVAPNDCRRPVIPAVEFVNETLNENLSVERDYIAYKSEKPEKLSFMDHPFLLTTSTKNLLLYLDNRLRMLQELRGSFSFLGLSHTDPYLKLRVARERLVEDALIAVRPRSCLLYRG